MTDNAKLLLAFIAGFIVCSLRTGQSEMYNDCSKCSSIRKASECRNCAECMWDAQHCTIKPQPNPNQKKPDYTGI
jgi:hypothetical protein